MKHITMRTHMIIENNFFFIIFLLLLLNTHTEGKAGKQKTAMQSMPYTSFFTFA